MNAAKSGAAFVLEIYRVTLLSNILDTWNCENKVLEIYRITLLSNVACERLAIQFVLEIYRITLLSNIVILWI